MTTRNVERAAALAITREIESAVNEVLERHGLTKGRCRTTYGDIYKVAIEATPVGAPTKEAQAFTLYEFDHKLPAAALGATIKLGTKSFTITGYSPRSPRRPITLQGVADGKTYKAPTDQVRRALALR